MSPSSKYPEMLLLFMMRAFQDVSNVQLYAQRTMILPCAHQCDLKGRCIAITAMCAGVMPKSYQA